MAVSEFQALLYSAQKEKYKRNYYVFFKDAVKVLEPSTDWDLNWHIKYLCDLLQTEAKRIKDGIPRANDWIINIPFRSGKSLIVSICFNAWWWTFYPEGKVMTISYAESLAVKQSYLTRILMNSEWYKKYFPEVQLMRDDNAKGAMTNTHGGTRQSYGMNGAITGSGADIIIVDDGNKVKESKKQLQNANVTFDEMIFNRLNNPETGVRFIIQQRINQIDLSGHVTAKDGNEFQTICIPAELGTNLEPTHLVEHYVDGLFWSNRFNRTLLKQYHVALGSRGYNSQLNQKTKDSGGNILKEQWFNIIDYDENKHKNLKWEMVVDSAFTAKQKNDPTGILICAKLDNNLLIKKAISIHLEFPDLIKKLIELANQYKVSRIFVEPKASGLSIIQQLRKISKLNVVELPTSKDDKETRCNAISPTVEAERIFLLDGSWIKDFIDEVTNFPLAAHDDMLDCLMYAIEKFLIKKGFNYKM